MHKELRDERVGRGRLQRITGLASRSERDLMSVCGFWLWSVNTIGIFAMSYSDQLAPGVGNGTRLLFGLPVLAVLISHATWVQRLRPNAHYHAHVFGAYAAIAAQFVLLYLTPATWGILVILFANAMYAAYFFNSRDLVASLCAITFVALWPAVATAGLAPDWPGEQHTWAQLTVWIPTLWIVGVALHVQRRALRKALRDAQHKAYTDPLTGLANLRALREYADEAMEALPDGSRRNVGMLLIDLDDFKTANTLHGHLGGDRALRVVAKQLSRTTLGHCMVARIGGDEFVVMIEDASRQRLREMAGLYAGAVRGAQAAIGLEGVRPDASVGIAIFPEDGETLEELLTVADQSMYEAKSSSAMRRASSRPSSVVPIPTENRPELEFTNDNASDSLGKRLSLAHRWIGLPAYARFAAVAWALGSLSVLVSMAMPDADRAFEHLVVPLSAIGVVVAAISLFTLPRAGSFEHIAIDLFCFATVAGGIYLTGGVDGQAMPLLFLVLVYQSMFLGTRGMWLRLTGPAFVVASPLLYDDVFRGDAPLIGLATLYSTLLIATLVTMTMSVNQTFLERARRRSQRLASTDPLTGLPNRRAFKREMELALAAMKDPESTGRLALVMIDLDNFKDINTIMGHRVGDTLLCDVGQALARSARICDTVARIGGDEFAAILPGADRDEAQMLAERFVATVAGCTAKFGDVGLAHVSASAGFALYPEHGAVLDELLHAADAALMAVKAGGKNAVQLGEMEPAAGGEGVDGSFAATA